MIRFDQVFHLMISFFFDFCDLAGLSSVFPDYRVDLKTLLDDRVDLLIFLSHFFDGWLFLFFLMTRFELI
jgi:hypothetical protein